MILPKYQTDLKTFKHKALQWASVFDVMACLDSNGFSDQYSRFETLIAVGAKHELRYEPGKGFEALDKFRQQHTGWMFGFLSYDLKNEVEDLSSNNPDHLKF